MALKDYAERARLGAIMVCASFLGLSACGAPETAAPEEIVRPARLLVVTAGAAERQLNLPATIEASATVEMSFEVGGYLETLPVQEGQAIGQGELIAQLRQADFRNDLASAQSQYNTAEAEFERAASLVERGTISRSVYEQRQTSRDVARVALDTARNRLSYSTLTAPIDGIISSVPGVQFQNVGPQQPIVILQSTGVAEAVVQAPATLVAYSERLLQRRAFVTLDAAPDVEIPVAFLSSVTQADPRTQTFEVRFTFTPPDGLVILPGMTGTVQLNFAIAEDSASDEELTRIRVPLSAILSDGEAQYVWVVDPDTMRVSRREIQVGEGLGGMMLIEAGLSEGETIVSAGASFLHEGMMIRAYEG